MKKLLTLIVLMPALLCGCGAAGSGETAPAAAPAATAAPAAAKEARVITDVPTGSTAGMSAEQSATADTAPAETPSQAPAEEAEAPEIVSEEMRTALELVGSSASELYSAIGYPESSDYATSCLGDGEDGNLYYDGFTVYTYRENGTETIRHVE